MESGNQKQSNTLVVALLVALLVALVGLVVLIAVVFARGSAGDVSATATALPEAAPTIPGDLIDPSPTGLPVATIVPPTPEPSVPQGTVIARNGVNVRQGPSTVYPILFVAPFGSEVFITGTSADREWWVILVPEAPNGQGWVDNDFIAAENANDVPVVPAPPVPVTPTPVPPVIENFAITPNPINDGECTDISWAVGNGATSMRIIKNGFNILVEGSQLSGQFRECPNSAGAKSYRLEARNEAGDVASQEIILTVQEVNPLADTNWTLSAMNVNGVPAPGTTITALFGADFTLSGNGGCNAYSSSYAISGNAIAISPAAAGTLISCGETIDQQEQLYFSLLMSATSFERSGSQLILRSGIQEVLRFNQS